MFKKRFSPLSSLGLSENRFRGRAERREDNRRHVDREKEDELFIPSDKEKIGVYHTFNWASSFYSVGRWM